MQTRLDAYTHANIFRFFDVDLRLTSDSSRFHALFMALYARLRVTAPRGPTATLAAVFTHAATPDDTTSLHLDGTHYRLPDDPRLLPQLVDAVAHAALTHVRSHHLIHGATLCHGDHACLIAGASGQGKSTLAVAMARTGLCLLSDEIGAVDAGGRVHAFPRAVRMRPPSLALLGLTDPDVVRHGNWLLVDDINDAEPRAQATPTLTHLFLLGAKDTAPSSPGSRLLLTGATCALRRRLRTVPGVVDVTGDGRYAEVVTAGGAPSLVEEIRRRCRQAHALVLDVTAATPTRPTFATTPHIEPLTPRDALFSLLPHLIGGPATVTRRASTAGDGPPHAGALLADLAAILARVRCYRVTPGTPADTAAMLRSRMTESEPCYASSV